MCRARHGREHGCKPGISPKHFQHQQPLMGASYRAQAVRQFNRTRDTGAEPNAVIGAGHIVIHRFGNGNDLHPFLIHADAITERIIPTNRDKIIKPRKSMFFNTSGVRSLTSSVYFS